MRPGRPLVSQLGVGHAHQRLKDSACFHYWPASTCTATSCLPSRCLSSRGSASTQLAGSSSVLDRGPRPLGSFARPVPSPSDALTVPSGRTQLSTFVSRGDDVPAYPSGLGFRSGCHRATSRRRRCWGISSPPAPFAGAGGEPLEYLPVVAR